MALTRARLAQVNTTVASLQDPITLINRGADNANIDVGFIFNRDGGSSSNVAFIWDETNNLFSTVFTDSTGGTNSNVNIVNYANLKVDNVFANIGGGTSQANIFITGSLLPTANVTYDLGSDTRRFKTLWLANNTLDLGGETLSTDGQGNWVFSSNGSTISLGTGSNFNPPTINSTTGTFTALITTGATILSNTSGNTVVASTTQSTNTSTGALVINGGLGVAGNFYGANVNGTTATFSSISGTLTTASQPNITTLDGVTTIGSNFGDLTAQGNLTVVGNLTVQGNTLTIGSNNLTVVDSIIDLHTFANLEPHVSDDGRDIGLRFHYYKGADRHAFLGWENDHETLIYLATATETGSNIVGTAGNVKFGSLLLANTTVATSTSTGALQVLGGVGIAGALYINNTNDVSANIGILVNNDISTSANLGAYQLYANANVGTIHTTLTALDANVGSFEHYANTKIGTNANGNLVAGSGTESTSTTTGAIVVSGGVGASGNVTASKFYTNSGVFWSANGVSALATGGTTAGENPPANKKYGDLWYNTTNDVVYEYLTDGTSDYWIDISSQTIAANTSNVIAGNLTVSGELFLTGTAWTSYTPTWTTSGTAPSLGNGSLTGKYKQIGKTVFVRVRLQIGSSTTTGTGNWRISLPVVAADSAGVVMPATYLDNGVNWHIGVVNCEYDGDASYVVPLKGSSPSGAVDAASPFTWNAGDSLVFNGSYEAA